MKKEIISVDKRRGIYQITTTDERWYTLEGTDDKSGLPDFAYVPSSTWISSYVYKDVGFYKWLASKGWDEAEAIKAEAGDKGSKVHNAIERMLDGVEVKMEDKFYSKLSDADEELTAEEYTALYAFKEWFDKEKPEILMKESTVVSKKYNFAGTVDCVAKLGGDIYILDWKTSQNIWPSMEAQLSSYKQALKEMGKSVSKAKLAILQLGYRRNKRGWKFTEVEDQFKELFIPALHFWTKANSKTSPKQVELPLSLKLDLPETSKKAPKTVAKVEKGPSPAKTPQNVKFKQNNTKKDGPKS